MIYNDYINEAWMVLYEKYVEGIDALSSELTALLITKNFISQQKETKLFIGKIIVLWKLITSGKNISNHVQVNHEKDFF